MIFDKHANLKYKFGNRHFWSEGYYVSTVGLNGSGKSTLAHVLAKKLGYFEIDSEDYYFPEQRESRQSALEENKNESVLPKEPTHITFSGPRPRTAYEMYEHTKEVNSYYFGEIGIDADNEGTIYECRKRGFDLLETTEGFLENKTVVGSFDEQWLLRKVLRRFIWHDCIHAKAMYRMAIKTFGESQISDVFCFF